MRVDLLGTYAKPQAQPPAPRGSRGIVWAVNQNQGGLLIGWWYQPVVNPEWKQQFWRYFYFSNKELRHQFSVTVQSCKEIFVLHVYEFCVTYLCKHRSYASLKSEVM